MGIVFTGNFSFFRASNSLFVMKAIVKLPVLVLALSPFLTRCTNASSHENNGKPIPPAVKKTRPRRVDSLSSEPQITHIASGNLETQIARVVASAVDIFMSYYARK